MQEIVVFSDVGIITQNTTHINIVYLYKGHSTNKSLENGEGVDKESNKNYIEMRACIHKSGVPHTNASMYFLLQLNLYSLLASHEALIILKQAIKRAHP